MLPMRNSSRCRRRWATPSRSAQPFSAVVFRLAEVDDRADGAVDPDDAVAFAREGILQREVKVLASSCSSLPLYDPVSVLGAGAVHQNEHKNVRRPERYSAAPALRFPVRIVCGAMRSTHPAQSSPDSSHAAKAVGSSVKSDRDPTAIVPWNQSRPGRPGRPPPVDRKQRRRRPAASRDSPRTAGSFFPLDRWRPNDSRV